MSVPRAETGVELGFRRLKADLDQPARGLCSIREIELLTAPSVNTFDEFWREAHFEARRWI